MKRLRTGILTYHFSENFGAVLQAYALRRWFLERGHEAEFVNYHPGHVEEGGDFVSPWDPRRAKSNLKVLYLKLSSLRQRLFGDRAQAGKFERFRTHDLQIGGARIADQRDLASIRGRYDLLVAGSDQIWSPSTQRGFDPAYFLAFDAGPATRRISYAASFGRDALPAERVQEAGRLLQQLDAISVRERSGVEIVNAAAGKQATYVPDPTLLHADYDALLSSSGDQRSGHVFCYALRTGHGIRDIATSVAQRLDTEILSPYNVHRRWREIGTTVHPGPEDWVRLLANAGFVVTNSFHGTIFAILFRRPFIVAGLPGAKAGLSARSRNVLAEVGLSDRFVEAGDTARARDLVEAAIDWDAVEPRVAAYRKAGDDYLRRELDLAAAR